MSLLTVLALDPGSLAMGWAVLSVTPQTETLCASGVLHATPTDPAALKHREMTLALVALVTRYQPQRVVYEEYVYFGAKRPVNIQGSFLVNRIIGVILTLEQLAPYPTVVPLLPQEWGRYLVGKREHTKADIAWAVNQRLGLHLSARGGGHQTDAVGLGLVGIDCWRLEQRVGGTPGMPLRHGVRMKG